MERYSIIESKLAREFLLLQGKGCKWGKCTFCDYTSDCCNNPYETNRGVLQRVTGRYGVLDIINSGSALELDSDTIEEIKATIERCNIKTLWFEAHYMYRKQLESFATQFVGTEVKFRCGVESFDPKLRSRWCKGIGEDVTVEDIARYFRGVCLLCCLDDDSPERIMHDIELAKRHFEYFSINLFCNNSTPHRRNEQLVEWFTKEIYPTIKDDSRIEVLLNNTDLGVG